MVRERSEDPLDATLVVNATPVDSPREDSLRRRYGFREAPPEVGLQPRLATRPIIVNPEAPLSLPGGEEVTVFAGSPLWIRLEAGDPPQALLEEPSFRPSDTWFGPDTREGELCFAGRTRARIHLENIVPVPHRAITAVHIVNRASGLLDFEKLQLPVPHLSLYEGEGGQLWTESIRLERDEDGDFAKLHVGSGPPPVAGESRRLSGPRTEPEKRHLFHAFGRMFGTS